MFLLRYPTCGIYLEVEAFVNAKSGKLQRNGARLQVLHETTNRLGRETAFQFRKRFDARAFHRHHQVHSNFTTLITINPLASFG